MKTPWLPKKPKSAGKCKCKGTGKRFAWCPGKGIVEVDCAGCGGKGFI